MIKRISREVLEISENPPEGIKMFLNEEDITDIQASIEGPGKQDSKMDVQCKHLTYFTNSWYTL